MRATGLFWRRCATLSARPLLPLFAVSILLLSTARAEAIDRSWLVISTSDSWSTASNWSGNAVPTASDTASITNGGTASVTSGATCQYLRLSPGMVILRAGQLAAAQDEYIGHSGQGTFIQSGGSNGVTQTFAGSLYLGYNLGASGTYNLSGGALSFVKECIGNSGSGLFTHSSGINTVSFFGGIYVGYNAGAAGTYDLNGPGQLSCSSNEYVGYSGTGTFTQSAGTNNTSFDLTVSKNAGAVGTYSLSGGKQVSWHNDIGSWGTGTFARSGGTSSTDSVWLGEHSSGSGTYNLIGAGQLTSLEEDVGGSGAGTFTQSAGSNSVSGSLYLGRRSGGSGTYTLNNGLLSAGAEYVGYDTAATGSFQQSGGTNAVTLLSVSKSGRYQLTGGVVRITGGLQNAGTLDLAGTVDALTLSNSVIVDFSKGTILNAGATSLVLGASSLMIVSSAYDPTGQFYTYSNANLTHIAGTTLTLLPGQGFAGAGSIDDPVDCQGTIAAVAGSLINLNAGLTLRTGGTITLGDGNLVVENNSGMSGGQLSATYQYVGKTGSGVFSQSAGSNSIGLLHVGYNLGASGTYNLSGAALLSANEESIGDGGTGVFVHSAGTNTVRGLYVGQGSRVGPMGASGTYSLSGNGQLSTHSEYLGYRGTGTFTQSGGTNTVGNDTFSRSTLSLGYYSDDIATYGLTGGGLTIIRSKAPMPSPSDLSVGVGGTGTFNLGDANGTGTISETGSGVGVCMMVRTASGGSGTVQGWGNVALSGTLTNNGQIIADGYGTDRTLDLSTFSSVGRTIANPTSASGSNGYFAQNHGKLAMPLISVDIGNPACNWGQSSADNNVDLVNAIHLAFSNVTTSGSLNIALLATDRTDVPAFGSGILLDVWDFNASGGLAFGSANLTIRYDNALAAALGIAEDHLHLLHFNDSGWDDVTSSIDTTNNWISANGITSFSLYAVGTAPEPGTWALLVSAAVLGWPLWRRRRRRAEG